MTDEEKDELLERIVKIYLELKVYQFDNKVSLIELIQRDIKVFEEQEEFETAQALKDIIDTYNQVIKDLADDELVRIIKELNEQNNNGLQL